MSSLIVHQATKLGEAFNMGGTGQELIQVLKATTFKGDVSDAQMAALMVVANQYHLNPFTKEIYAFPDKQNGIVPVVGVDGWSRIINQHPQFDGMEFRQSENMVQMPGAKTSAPEWMECVMFRKDRSHPVVIREYLDEVYREPFNGKYGSVNGPWQTHTKRFLRHKTMIQCARLAFGFVGIYDEDEADRIVESQGVRDMGPAEVVKPAEPEVWTDEAWEKTLPKILAGIKKGKTIEQALAWLSGKAKVSPEQEADLRKRAADQHKQAPQEASQAPGEPLQTPEAAFTYAEVADRLNNAKDMEELAEAGSVISGVRQDQRAELVAIFEKRATELEGVAA